jgi:very-short-patch-repair endonuclease
LSNRHCQENLVEIVRVLWLADLISGMIDDDFPHPRPLSKVERGDSEPLHPSSVERAGIVTVETGLPSELLRDARRLRKNQPEAEHIMWKALRNRKLNNWKFRRQHPISEGFILDFYCVETKVAIELDGAHHQLNEQKEYDKNRTEFLEELGIRIIRILNQEVLSSKEVSCGRSLPSQTLLLRAIVNPPSASPLSIYGEGQGVRKIGFILDLQFRQ